MDDRSDYYYWQRWIKDALKNKHYKAHKAASDRAWSEYEASSIDSVGGEFPTWKTQYAYPKYWSSVKLLEPAYYARTPTLSPDRRFGVSDLPSLVASTVAERLGDYLVERCNFDEAMQKAVLDYINTGKATTQVCYDVTETERSEYLGEGFEPEEGEEYEQDENGGYSRTISEIDEDSQIIYVAPISYDEILHTPEAKCQAEIKEQAYKFSMPRAEAEARFPKLDGARVQWKSTKSEDDETDADAGTAAQYLEGWEIYCFNSKTVKWFSEQFPGELLDEQEDPYGFDGFFPSPDFIIESLPSKHLYPTPGYTHLRPTIEQLHTLYSKIFDLIDGIRRRCLVDGSHPELLRAFEELDDNEFITVQDLAGLVQKVGGNLQNLIWYLPVQELVSAITELVQLDGFFSQKFDEFFGVPDVLRGVTDPLVTASADRLASGAAHDRFRYHKRQIQKLARDSIAMMVDLALRVFSDEKIARIAGVRYMQPQEQQAFPEALAILRDDRERLIRIDIETDSTSFVDERHEQESINQAVQVLVTGLQQITQMLQVSPEFAAVSLHALIETLDSIKGGERFIEEVKGYTNQLIQKAMQPSPPAPPPPDYEAMKIQLQQQKIQLEHQEAMSKQQLEAQKLAIDSQKNQMQQMLEQQKQQFLQYIQQNYLSLDQFKAQINAQETATEEMRLMREADAKLIEAQKPRQEKGGETTVVINNAARPEPEPLIVPTIDPFGL